MECLHIAFYLEALVDAGWYNGSGTRNRGRIGERCAKLCLLPDLDDLLDRKTFLLHGKLLGHLLLASLPKIQRSVWAGFPVAAPMRSIRIEIIPIYARSLDRNIRADSNPGNLLILRKLRIKARVQFQPRRSQDIRFDGLPAFGFH